MVGLRDSYRHLLTAIRLQTVYHKGIGDISNKAWKPGNVMVRAKSVGRIFFSLLPKNDALEPELGALCFQVGICRP